MNLYTAEEANQIIDRFSKKLNELESSSPDMLSGISIYMRALTEMDEWLERMAMKDLQNGFKLFGWETLKGDI